MSVGKIFSFFSFKLAENGNLQQGAVSGWRMFTVRMTNNNNEPIAYTSSMIGVDEDKAKELAINNDWMYGVKSVDSVVFDACR